MTVHHAVLGVDACRSGWVGALTGDGARVQWLGFTRAADLLAVPAAAVGIDMPMGLAEAAPRRCDVLARRRLPGRASCVFPAPVRAALGAGSYREACDRSRAASGRALPLQTFHLLARITDLDGALDPSSANRVLEVHPEVSFAAMAGGPLPSKRTRAGLLARAELLGDPDLSGRPPGAAAHDCYDALACAWSARRYLTGQAEILPPDGERDGRGLPMRIVV